MANKIREMFSRITRRYDFLNRVMSLGFDRRWRSKAVSLLPRRNNLRILDVCAGTGDFALAYLKRHEKKGSVILVDFSEDPLILAGKKLARRELSLHTAIAAGDALSLPFRDRTFDAVMCAFGVRNIEHPVDILLESRRVLRKGGKFVVLDFFRPRGFFKKLVLYTFGTVFIPVMGAIFAGSFRAYWHLVRSIRRNLTLEEFCLLFETAGFKNVSGEDIGIGFASIAVGNK